ncbi:hypothetical protein D9M72_537630 [compost metagenome]
MLSEEDEAKEGGLGRLGARIGGADRKVAEGEQMDEQEGRSDLRQPADDSPEVEGAIRHWKRTTGHLPEQKQIERGERQAEAEAHEGCARRAHDAFQVFLHGRADILKECRSDGDEDPGFHGCELARGSRHCQGPAHSSVSVRLFLSLGEHNGRTDRDPRRLVLKRLHALIVVGCERAEHTIPEREIVGVVVFEA